MIDLLPEIKERAAAATPGPWKWFGNTDVRDVYLATARWGRLYVMGFRRWGMNGAQPMFAHGRKFDPDNRDESIGGVMQPASALARYEVAPSATNRSDPEVYRADLNGLKTPDAEFIAHSRADVEWLVSEVERLRALLPEPEAEHAVDCQGCDGPGIVPCAADRVIGDFAYRDGQPIKRLRRIDDVCLPEVAPA